ncbi:hypothetical protein [Dongshaea marina]|uniref:hypothetical protein n=1 Tax=Dongshaea marina TaxID=2047966 RepID=UPI000D3EA6DF|nr:hypothetical protein [Dongshaea marina]
MLTSKTTTHYSINAVAKIAHQSYHYILIDEQFNFALLPEHESADVAFQFHDGDRDEISKLYERLCEANNAGDIHILTNGTLPENAKISIKLSVWNRTG